MHIRVITPIVTRDFRSPEDLAGFAGEGLEISHAFIEMGPASIESAFDETLAAPGALDQIIKAENEGADAAVIDCLGDIGMHAGREAVEIPVVGAGEASMHVAAMLGHRFSILAPLKRVFQLNENQAKVYGVSAKLASLRAVDLPVLELETDRSALTQRMIAQGIRAIEEDGAHVLLFGCTGMNRVAEAVASGLQESGYSVPVVEPLTTAIRVAEMLVKLRLPFSKVTYPFPLSKIVEGYPFARLDKEQ
jgi:allantoin racemase